jgi:DNA repair protein SbcD/Mre11
VRLAFGSIRTESKNGRDAIMAAKPLRLLHAANLQLDCPLRGIGSVRDEVREIVETATLTAFERIVMTSLEKDVDALVITGNTFDASYPSLAAEVALRDGFSRLAERQIPVFIVPGRIDPGSAWQEMPPLPKNVTVFLDPGETPIDLTDHGHLLATILPVTAETSIEPEELANIHGVRNPARGDRPFMVGLLLTDHVVEKQTRPRLSPARFAALDWLLCPAGADTDSLPLTDGHVFAQAAPQGMSPSEKGAHGATLLEVDSNRKTKKTAISLAPVRWEQINQTVDNISSQQALVERMIAHLERLPLLKGEALRIIEWQLDRSSSDTLGWATEAATNELSAALTEISDHPEGLRYVHRIHPVELDLSLIEPAHREVLTEYLLALERRGSVDQRAFSKWLSDAHVGEVLKSGDWELWTQSIQPDQVKDRAKLLGWNWFSTIGKK